MNSFFQNNYLLSVDYFLNLYFFICDVLHFKGGNKIKIKYLNTLQNKKPKFRPFEFNSEILSCSFSNEIPVKVNSGKKKYIIII